MARTSLRRVKEVKVANMKFSPDLLLSDFIDAFRANSTVVFSGCTYTGNFFSFQPQREDFMIENLSLNIEEN